MLARILYYFESFIRLFNKRFHFHVWQTLKGQAPKWNDIIKGNLHYDMLICKRCMKKKYY